MIKKWGNFIKENIDLYRLSSDQIIKRINKITETPESEYENGATGMKSDLIFIFTNNLRLTNGSHVVNLLYTYTEHAYNKKSKEIRSFFDNIHLTKFGEDLDTDYIASQILHNKPINEIKDIIIKLLEFFIEVKENLGPHGYPKDSKLNDELGSICKMSLIDEDILKFYGVGGGYNNISILLKYDNLKIDTLIKITDDISSLCNRINDATGLENTFIEFDGKEYISVGFEFPK